MKKSSTLTACIVIIAAFFGGWFVANKNVPAASTQIDNTSTSTRAATGTAILYGKIEDFNIKTESTRLQLLEFVQGSDNQEQAALEVGQCTLERIENDECLPNPFFVRNTEKRLTLPIAADARVEVYARVPGGGFKSDDQGNIYTESVTPAVFANMLTQVGSLKELPFIFTTTHGVITKIQEQYIP